MSSQNKPDIHAVAYISWRLHISISFRLQKNHIQHRHWNTKGSSLSPTHSPTHTYIQHRLVLGPGGLLLGSQGVSLVWWRHFVWSRGRLQQTPEEMPISYWLCYGLKEREGGIETTEKGRVRERAGEREGTTIQDAEWKKKTASNNTEIRSNRSLKTEI